MASRFKARRIARERYTTLEDGREVELYTLTVARGIELRVMNYGGIVVSLLAPDREGQLDDVVLGFDDAAGYLSGASPYFGAIVGRYANRIARGRFTLDGVTYRLTINDGENQLHGGTVGFDKALWKATANERGGVPSLLLTHVSPDGDQGYPGRLTASVQYTLNEWGALVIDYRATTDAPTVVNLSHHSYFNLAGTRRDDILDHVLQISADRFTPVDRSLIPTGELADVTGTPFDFRTPTAIGARIGEPNEQLELGRGYDHNYVLRSAKKGLSLVARVREPLTGRTLTVHTSEPGMQFYSGNFLDASIRGKGGRIYGPRSGFCLETQHFPDSPNHPEFPSTVLRPGQEYRSRTVYTFGVEDLPATARIRER